MSSVRTRIWTAFASIALARLIRMSEQIVLVPIYLATWGVGKYGEWLALTAVASLASISNVGLAQAGASDIILKISAGDREGATASFTTAIALAALTAAIFGLLAAILCWNFDIQSLMKITQFSARQTSVIVAMILLTVAMNFFIAPLSACIGATAGIGISNFGQSAVKVAEIVAIATVLFMRLPPTYVVACMLVSALASVVVQFIIIERVLPWIRLRLSYFSVATLKRYFLPSLSYLALYLSTNVIGVQAPRLMLFSLLGAGAVTIFAVFMTYTRTIQILTNTLANIVQVEVGRAFGSGEMARFRRMSETLFQITAWAGLFFLLIFVGFAKWIIPFWTGGKLVASMPLVVGLSIAALVGSIADTVTLPLITINRVTTIAYTRLLAMLIGLGAAALALRSTGSVAIACALGFAELCTILAGLRTLSEIVKTNMFRRIPHLLRWPSEWVNEEAALVLNFVRTKMRQA